MKRTTFKKKMESSRPLSLAPADDGSPGAAGQLSGRPGRPSTTGDEGFAEAARSRREADYSESFEMVWNDEVLQPFSRGRESLLGRLIALDLKAGVLDDLPVFLAHIEKVYSAPENAGQPALSLGQLCDLDYYLPSAAKLLYLCSHTPEQWDHLRASPSRFIRAIEDWTENNIAPGQVEEACLLAQKIRSQHRSQMAIHQPVKGSGKVDSGN